MSETTETVETATEPTEEQQELPIESEEKKPTETVEFWKQKARENEKRAKQNASAAEKLAAIEAEKLSESEKVQLEREQLARDRDEARQEALRWRIAAKHGISDEDAELFLTGSDEDTLTRQAERLVDRTPVPSKGTHVPGVGNQPPKPPSQAEQIRAAEAAGDSQTAMALKAQQLADLARKNH